jgi:hypothetical protein
MLNNVIDSQTQTHNRDLRKVSKRQHQYPQFGHTQGEIEKKPAKKYISIQLGVKLRKPSILMVPEFHLSFFFPERLHCCYIDFHCSYLYSYYNSSRTLCIKCWDSAFRTEFQHFILRFSKIFLLIHMDTTKRGVRGWKEAQRQDEHRVNLRISLITLQNSQILGRFSEDWKMVVCKSSAL